MLPPVIRKVYPRASDNRQPVSHPAVRTSRISFFKAAALNFAILQLLFLGLFSYLFGSLFQQPTRTHGLRILWVDYDGGAIGDAVRGAYSSLKSESYPTIVEHSAADYQSETDLREAVCNTNYWAALYTVPGASERLVDAISGSTSQYNSSNALFYIWNEARYPTVVDAAISGSLVSLSNTARAAYMKSNSSFALDAMPANDSAALLAFSNPWLLSSINIQPTTQGARVVYNTISIVLILIQDFFFLAHINGLYAQHKIYTRIWPTRIIITRDLISGTFTMVGSLLISAVIWAFKGNWDVSGKQFAINWMILWLFSHVNFMAIDVFTIWVPPQYVPMMLITWIVTNVTSIILPFALSSPFYRWGYALPAHAVYEILTDNWSSGCNPHLHFALPILFAYEVIGLVLTTIGVYRRCHLAVEAEEAGQEAMRLRVEVAVKKEREQARLEILNDLGNNEQGSSRETGDVLARSRTRRSSYREGPPSERDPAQTEKDNEESLERNIESMDNEIVRMETYASQGRNLGPSFRLVGSNPN
ncbi:hypothetical protein CC79DRAFT_1362667 [Sarocladium strictum]